MGDSVGKVGALVSDRDIVARHVGIRIKELREQKGIAPSTLADHLDISLADLTHFERGEWRIAPNLLVAMARLCNVGIDWFFRDAPATERTEQPHEEEMLARFLALPEARDMIGTFVRIANWEGRATVVSFARMLGSSASR